jgi:hypothetical protein
MATKVNDANVKTYDVTLTEGTLKRGGVKPQAATPKPPAPPAQKPQRPQSSPTGGQGAKPGSS